MSNPILDAVERLARRVRNLETNRRAEVAGAMPLFTTAGRPAAGKPGRMIFNTTTNKPNWDDGTVWRDAAGNVV